jgi:hypothetical protein
LRHLLVTLCCCIWHADRERFSLVSVLPFEQLLHQQLRVLQTMPQCPAIFCHSNCQLATEAELLQVSYLYSSFLTNRFKHVCDNCQ